MNRQPEAREQVKWYLKPSTVIIAILCIGPFALPVVWLSSAFKKSHKVYITIAIILLSLLLVRSSTELYQLLLKNIRELQNIINPPADLRTYRI